MTTYHGYGPWVGAGTRDNPYALTEIFHLSLRWAAQKILAGSTCFDPVDGSLLYADDPELQSQLVQAVDAVNEREIFTPSGIIGGGEFPPELDALIAPLLEGDDNTIPIALGEITAFAERAVACKASISSRLAAVRDDLAWDTDPIVSAITVLDDLRNGDDEAQRLWQHYRSVINPHLPTPLFPSEFLNPRVDETQPASLNMARIREIYDNHDEQSSQVRLADLCYELIVYTECVDALTDAGYC